MSEKGRQFQNKQIPSGNPAVLILSLLKQQQKALILNFEVFDARHDSQDGSIQLMKPFPIRPRFGLKQKFAPRWRDELVTLCIVIHVIDGIVHSQNDVFIQIK